MLTKLVLLFVGLPLVEMMILVKLGQEIGFWPTIFLVIATGVAGAALARAQGLWVWIQIQQELQMGKIPGDKLVDGLLILIGGIVLLTPGLLTDLFGLALLVPFTRDMIKRWLQQKLKSMSEIRESHISYIIR